MSNGSYYVYQCVSATEDWDIKKWKAFHKEYGYPKYNPSYPKDRLLEIQKFNRTYENK